MGLTRTPPAEVIAALRTEVGFGCPVADCGSPYLTWHHFDPEWSEEQHHNPAGMIALCREHHDKAGVGAFTKPQLRELKTAAAARQRDVRGRFDWMRTELLGVVGGNFYIDVPVLVRVHDQDVVWFNRDANNYLLVNVELVSTSGEPRMSIRDNVWFDVGDPETLVCPPSGRKIAASYRSGDRLSVEFRTYGDPEEFDRRYPRQLPADVVAELKSRGVTIPDIDSLSVALAEAVDFPLTAVEVNMSAPGTGLDFSPVVTVVGTNQFAGNVVRGGKVGLQIG